MKDNYLMLPLIEISKKIGFSVEEVSKGKKYKVTGDQNRTYYLEVGKNTLTVEPGNEFLLNYFIPAVQIIDQTVMVPFEFISWFTSKTIEGDFPNYQMYTTDHQSESIYMDEAGNVLNQLPVSFDDLLMVEHTLSSYSTPGKWQDYNLEISRGTVTNKKLTVRVNFIIHLHEA